MTVEDGGDEEESDSGDSSTADSESSGTVVAVAGIAAAPVKIRKMNTETSQRECQSWEEIGGDENRVSVSNQGNLPH